MGKLVVELMVGKLVDEYLLRRRLIQGPVAGYGGLLKGRLYVVNWLLMKMVVY